VNVSLPDEWRQDPKQRRLLIITLLCYATGYPIALWLNQPWGWILVTAGGFFLMWLVILIIRRINAKHGAAPPQPTTPDSSTTDQP